MAAPSKGETKRSGFLEAAGGDWPSALVAFAECLEATKALEGYRDHPYRCSTGHLTIGYGHRLEDAYDQSFTPDDLPGVRCTPGQAYRWLLADMDEAARAARLNLRWWTASDAGRWRYPGQQAFLHELGVARWAGLVEMAFQLGGSGQRKFRKMGAAIVRREWGTARREALDSLWARQTPVRAVRVAGLLDGSLTISTNVRRNDP